MRNLVVPIGLSILLILAAFHPVGKESFGVTKIVIDPGHGGHDPGCLGSKSREKHLALAIGLELQTLLRQTFPDLNIIMTRDKDIFIPLYERAAIANRNKADLFISIHCNFMPGLARVRGSETYVMGLHTANHNLNVAKRENSSILREENYEKNYDYDPNSPEGHIMLSMFQNAFLEQSISFAEKVEAQFAQAKRKSRGVKQAGFVVLKETTMPSILIEAGFLSNRKEEQFLKTKTGQRTIANAILLAFIEYKQEVESGNYSMPQAITYDSKPQTRTVKQREVVVQHKTVSSVPTPKKEKERGLIPDLAPDPSYQPPTIEQEPLIISYGGEKVNENELPQTTEKGNPPRAYSAEEKKVLEETFSEKALKDIQFHVQLAASPSPLNTNTAKWQNLGYLIEITLENKLYKYQARNFPSIQEAIIAKRRLQNKGFKDAFVVSYKNGKRIPIEQARKELGLD